MSRPRSHSDPSSPTSPPRQFASHSQPRRRHLHSQNTPTRTGQPRLPTITSQARIPTIYTEQEEQEGEDDRYLDRRSSATGMGPLGGVYRSMRPHHLASESSTSSLQSSLSNLTLTGRDRSPLDRFLDEERRYGDSQGGRRSETPSVTSVSDDGEDDLRAGLEQKGWLERNEGHSGSLGKGKGKEREEEELGAIEKLPPEVLAHIFKLLPDSRDLFAALQVNRTWCLTAVPLLWCRPTITHAYQLVSLSRTLLASSPSLPYATSIRRLNLSIVSNRLNDYLIDGLEHCTRVDRLTITNAEGVTTQALKRVLSEMREVTAVDLSGTGCVEDAIVRRIGESMPKLQGLNLAGCKGVGDEGLKVIAERRQNFRRLKVGHCHRLTDLSMVPITRACPQLIEIDLSHDPQITDASLYSIFLHLSHLRELRMAGNGGISGAGIPNLADLTDDIEEQPDMDVTEDTFPWYAILDRRRIIPHATTLEHLRVVDFTSCSKLSDDGIENLVCNAPRIRHLVLAKCPELTDRALDSISRLERHLHHLHLGHAVLITDAGVTRLVRACARLRYIDVACCPNLTDLSVLEIAENLLKLRRVGLVKATHITDEAIYALVERHATLERIHLSYCEKISVKAIAFLLNRLTRLTHLSLTGVAAFKIPELQQFCRPTPSEFTEAQRESFCVYSGHGIPLLRKYLNSLYHPIPGTATSDEGSRRGSGSSQSSITGPTENQPTADNPTNSNTNDGASTSINPTEPTTRTFTSNRGRRSERDSRASTGSIIRAFGRLEMDDELDPLQRRSSAGATASGTGGGVRIPAPTFRYATAGSPRLADPSAVPGLPGSALTAMGPNFLLPEGSYTWPRRPPGTGSTRTGRAETTRVPESARGQGMMGLNVGNADGRVGDGVEGYDLGEGIGPRDVVESGGPGGAGNGGDRRASDGPVAGPAGERSIELRGGEFTSNTTLTSGRKSVSFATAPAAATRRRFSDE